jgi:hypothetical protein
MLARPVPAPAIVAVGDSVPDVVMNALSHLAGRTMRPLALIQRHFYPVAVGA